MLSRRLFLIGTAAFAATSTLAVEPLSRIILSDKIPFRRIHEINIAFDLAKDAPHGLSFVSLLDHNSNLQLRNHMNWRGCFRWLSMLGNEIEIEGENGLRIEIEPDAPGPAKISLIYSTERDRNLPLRLSWEGIQCKDGITRGSAPVPLEAA